MIESLFDTFIPSFEDIPIVLSVACFFLSFFIFVFLITQQQFKNLYGRWDARSAPADEAVLMELLVSGNVSLLSHLHRRSSTRDMIVRFASKLQGESINRLIGAYSYLGFAVDDFKLLVHSSLIERMKALQRCRILRLPLPEEAWARLLSHPDQVFRWATMEYLILLKAKDSLLWLLWFLKMPQNQEAGMALHLSCCFARSSPFALPFLLDHSDDKFLRKIWIQTLAIYPVDGIEEIILQKIGEKPDVDMLCMGMRALGASSSDQTKEFLLRLATHKDWNVRRLLAELLQAFSDSDIIDCLGYLAEDISFPVRMQALETLNALGDLGRLELERISTTEGHPSHQLVQKVISFDSRDRRSA